MGASGVGVETLLNKWEEAWPDDVNHRLARFSFSFNRCQSSRIVQLEKDRYLGQAPLLPMKDSLGNKVNYFEVYDYDDELFAEANSAIDKAIAAQPRTAWTGVLLKINALMAYERKSPEMTLQELKALADYHFKRKPDWEHETMGSVSPEQFNALMQDYCAALFRIGTRTSAGSLQALSQHLLTYCKDEPLYLDNLGSYYLVKKDYKKARKYLRPGAQEAPRRHDRPQERHPDGPDPERRQAGEEIPCPDGRPRRDGDRPDVGPDPSGRLREKVVKLFSEIYRIYRVSLIRST